jgi:ubiquinone/menaquinone biosynthesis C-methylase UbiE
MKNFNKRLPGNFTHPTSLPKSSEESAEWQKLNKKWWEEHPMRYDWNQELGYEEFSKEFFEEVDRRFFDNAREFMPYKKIPFDPLINFDNLKDADVLEIGVGMGSHASLLAKYSGSFTGIDLTEYAVGSTSKRFEVFNLPGKIIRMDAENLQFDDNSFDFIWSWGVIHHSSNTNKVLAEIQRVLKPGGEAVIMVYYRNFWNSYILAGFFRGVLMGEFFKGKSIHHIMQYYNDGATARIYTIPEWKNTVKDLFEINYIKIMGMKSEILPLPAGSFKDKFQRIVPDSFSRFLTNNLRMGSFLISSLKK